MDAREIRSKKAAIRQEIKERMQREFDRRKKEIKKRIKAEKIPVEEKREKYRKAVREEKLSLMELAREEFRARKRMLGLTPEQEALEEQYEPAEELPEEPPPIPLSARAGAEQPLEEEQMLEEVDDFLERKPRVQADEAFVYDDEEDSDVREFRKPIDESDALPPLPDLPPDTAAFVMPAPKVIEKRVNAHSLLYYIVNLVIHPVQTLDQFGEYLNAPLGQVKVVLFYLVSLIPLAFYTDIAESMPKDMLGTAASSALAQQSSVAIVIILSVASFLVYSFTIGIVNWFASKEIKLLSQIMYLAFVEGVCRLVIYSLTIFAELGAEASPLLMGVAGLLILAFSLWSLALSIIVLMKAAHYGFWGALALVIGGAIVRTVFAAAVIIPLGFLQGL